MLFFFITIYAFLFIFICRFCKKKNGMKNEEEGGCCQPLIWGRRLRIMSKGKRGKEEKNVKNT